MSRPEHVPFNSPEGIRRVNTEQEIYDTDPEKWEREEQEAKLRQQEEEYLAQCEEAHQKRGSYSTEEAMGDVSNDDLPF